MNDLSNKDLLRLYRQSVQTENDEWKTKLEQEALNRMEKCQHETVIYMGKLNNGRELFFCEKCNEYVRG